VKSHFSNNNLNNSISKKIITDKNDTSIDNSNTNKTFANIQPNLKTTLDFSQIRAETENSIIFNNRENHIINNSNIKEMKNTTNNNINIVKLKSSDADLPTEEDLINQKNAKIMLKSKLFIILIL